MTLCQQMMPRREIQWTGKIGSYFIHVCICELLSAMFAFNLKQIHLEVEIILLNWSIIRYWKCLL